MADNNLKNTVSAFMSGINSVVASKTVVGDPIEVGDTTLIPFMDVSFAMGAGAYNGEKKDKGAGGMGGKMSPSAVLVLKDGNARLVNIKNQDTMTKILDLVPDMVDRFSNKGSELSEDEVDDLLDEAEK